MLDPGELNRKVVIQHYTTISKNDYNEDVEDWTTFKTVWCKVVFDRGMEKYQSERFQTTTVATFRTYYTAGVNTKMRLSYKGKFWNVKEVREVGVEDGTDIIAELVE